MRPALQKTYAANCAVGDKGAKKNPAGAEMVCGAAVLRFKNAWTQESTPLQRQHSRTGRKDHSDAHRSGLFHRGIKPCRRLTPPPSTPP
jgi:hypothetical protein